MISYQEAIEIIRRCGKSHQLDSETIALEDIAGRVCAQKVLAPIANQPFDNSAMDGFAVCAQELLAATSQQPVALEVVDRLVAGDMAAMQEPGAGQCYEIMTGAPMPAGCDTVIPVENTEKQTGHVLFFAPSLVGNNVRYAGADFAKGVTVLSTGDPLEVRHILPLATLGVGQLQVSRKPRVAVLSTGLEVIDDLMQVLESGQIYNATAPYLRQMLPALGADTRFYGTVADEPLTFRQKLLEMIDNKEDIIVTTGAVSAGVCDFVRGELEALGAEILFHKVKMRPGKPILFAQLPNGGPLFVGLPGNPVATAAGLRFFVYPLMRAMQGLPAEEPGRAIVKSGSSRKNADFRLFLRAVSGDKNSTVREIKILQKQQSFMVSAFVEADIWVIAPEDVESINEGDVVEFYPFLPC